MHQRSSNAQWNHPQVRPPHSGGRARRCGRVCKHARAPAFSHPTLKPPCSPCDPRCFVASAAELLSLFRPRLPSNWNFQASPSPSRQPPLG
eukprot:361207-Chlamydomonas_euryale.AAC.6